MTFIWITFMGITFIWSTFMGITKGIAIVFATQFLRAAALPYMEG